MGRIPVDQFHFVCSLEHVGCSILKIIRKFTEIVVTHSEVHECQSRGHCRSTLQQGRQKPSTTVNAQEL